MTWNTGACAEVKGGGTAWVGDGDGYVRIEDADVRADELALAGGPDDDECDDGCTCGDDLG